MGYLFSTFFLVIFSTVLPGQTWTNTDVFNIPGDRRLSPEQAQGLTTDPTELRALLFAAPHESDAAYPTGRGRLLIPTPNGKTSAFTIAGYDVSAGSSFPGIRTWYGVNDHNPAQTVYLDWTERGFHAAVRGGNTEAYFVDPVVDGDLHHYQAYYRSDLGKPAGDFDCGTGLDELKENTPRLNKSLDKCELRQYRLAITATPEYSAYHGADAEEDAALVHSAIVTVINRLNQIFTHEISLRLQLVANNEKLYLYGSETNPFTANVVRVLSNENRDFQTNRIDIGSYDLGHVLTQGSNSGRAVRRSSCRDRTKSSGATSHTAPLGDPFAVDYLAHEISHQLGANHTQNNNCNYSALSGMEPGSGSTIMSYAGICIPNVLSSSDDYFHGRSKEEIAAFLADPFTGGRCQTVLDNELSMPDIKELADRNIPKGTPFRLTGSAEEPENLLYAWEQIDRERSIMPPVDTSRLGPLFRSYPPTLDSGRYFPRFSSVMAGTDPEWEELPGVGRDLNFRMSVTHFNAAYGCTDKRDMTVVVSEEYGPFVVTDPTTGSQWSQGQTAQIVWNVAGTDIDSFATPTVEILLSLDNGRTFSTILSETPNDGAAQFTVPNQVSDSARVMVRSNGNVFYNISQPGLTIVDAAGAPNIEISSLSATEISDCFSERDRVVFDFVTRSTGGASARLSLRTDNFPDGITARFEPPNPRPGGRFKAILTGFSDLEQGTFSGSITAESAEGMVAQNITITKFGNTPGAGPPITGPSGIHHDIRPTLSAVATGADLYQVQLGTNNLFDDIMIDRTSTDPTFSLNRYLEADTRYFWRIRSIQGTGGCGVSRWNTTSFISGACPVFSSASPTPVILSDGPPVQMAELSLEVDAPGKITDVDLVLLDIEHNYLNDLEIDLVSPAGTIVPIFRRSCGGNSDILINYDDEAGNPSIICPPVNPNAFIKTPDLQLSNFDDENADGIWTIKIRDNANQDGGQFNGFSLKTCIDRISLPVSYLDFTATARKADILLKWSIAAEINNAGFYVERRTADANTGWSELGFVAAGASYTFTDLNAELATDYFYRLRQTDLNGQVNYSELRTARIDGISSSALHIFPNPTGGKVSYRWALPVSERRNRSYSLTDTRGRLLREGQLFASGGSLSLADLPGGVYFVRVAGQEAERIVKL